MTKIFFNLYILVTALILKKDTMTKATTKREAVNWVLVTASEGEPMIKMVGNMEEDRQALSSLSVGRKQKAAGLRMGFKTSKPTPSDTPSTRPRLLILPKQPTNEDQAFKYRSLLEPFSLKLTHYLSIVTVIQPTFRKHVPVTTYQTYQTHSANKMKTSKIRFAHFMHLEYNILLFIDMLSVYSSPLFSVHSASSFTFSQACPRRQTLTDIYKRKLTVSSLF